MRPPLTRRRAIQGATAFAAALTVPTSRGFAANETLTVGCLGTGGRCRALMKSLAQISGVKIAAVADIWDEALAQGKGLADAQAFATKHFEAVLERRDIDAVVIGAPDHWHVPMTVAACQAGKDVYVEKPLTHDLNEGHAVIEAQNKHDRVVQVGTQQRSMPHLIQARQRIKDGRIGKVIKVRMSWNRNSGRVGSKKPDINPSTVDWKAFLGTAKDQPFDPYRFRNWRWFWDFGGGLFTDLMVHWVDVAHWVLDLDVPAKAVSIGNHIASAGVWETPDTVQTLLQYPNGVQVHFEGTFSNANRGAYIEFLGTDATLYADRGRYTIVPEKNRAVEPEEVVLGTGPRGADFYDRPDGELLHLTDWVEAVRARRRPSAPAEAGVSAAAAAHVANLALRSGQTASGQISPP